jgi:integrase
MVSRPCARCRKVKRCKFTREADGRITYVCRPCISRAARLTRDHGGWRTQSEILTRERRHVDLEAGTLRLDPGEAKNGEGRVVYLTPELRDLLAAQLERVRAAEKSAGRNHPLPVPVPLRQEAYRAAQA